VIETKIAYRNRGPIGIPKGRNMDCTIVAAAPLLPVGYVVSARRIADLKDNASWIPVGGSADTDGQNSY
jgi:hypothetical protein